MLRFRSWIQRIHEVRRTLWTPTPRGPSVLPSSYAMHIFQNILRRKSARDRREALSRKGVALQPRATILLSRYVTLSASLGSQSYIRELLSAF